MNKADVGIKITFFFIKLACLPSTLIDYMLDNTTLNIGFQTRTDLESLGELMTVFWWVFLVVAIVTLFTSSLCGMPFALLYLYN